MLLSKPQKELLELTRQYGALRSEQAEKLLQQKYSGLNFNTIVHQMECGGLLQNEQGILCESGRSADPDILLAIDIMLLMEPKHIEMMQKGTRPFALTFFRQRKEKLWRYDVCIAAPGREPVLCAMLEDIRHKYRMVVFVLDSPEQRTKLAVPCEHCFAWKENGAYKFYK